MQPQPAAAGTLLVYINIQVKETTQIDKIEIFSFCSRLKFVYTSKVYSTVVVFQKMNLASKSKAPLFCKYVMICDSVIHLDDVTSLLVLFTDYCHVDIIREDLFLYLCSYHHNYIDIHDVEAFLDYLDQNHLTPLRDPLGTSFGL